jgi:transposase
MRYIHGADRNQSTMFPEVLDDYVNESNPVRFIDAYIDGLDLTAMEFTYSEPKEKGRKPYCPGDLLKLYIYGYLNRIRSSRQLEKATHCNIELIWLMRRLQPDFKTIADFRKDNSKAIKEVFKNFTLLCKKMDLFGCELIAIDGSKFKAYNSNDRNFSKNKLTKLIKKIEDQIDQYLLDLNQGDEKEKDIQVSSTQKLQEKIEYLRKKRDKYKGYEKELEQSKKGQISLTDPDSRMMKTRQGKDVCYNVQIATDSKHKLIIVNEVCNDINDMHQLHSMAVEVKKILEVEKIDAVADAGYFEIENIKQCDKDCINTYVPRPERSRNKRLGLYTKKDFIYNPQNDTYQCPAGQILIFRGFDKYKSPKHKHRIYATHACQGCQQKQKCTRSKHSRRIFRWEHEELIDQLDQRVKSNPNIISRRKEMVEHPFGTLKNWMGQFHFMTKGRENAATEVNLLSLAYNMRRVLNIVNFKELMAWVS